MITDHAFVRLDYPGGKDGLCGVVVTGDAGTELCKHSADEHGSEESGPSDAMLLAQALGRAARLERKAARANTAVKQAMDDRTDLSRRLGEAEARIRQAGLTNDYNCRRASAVAEELAGARKVGEELRHEVFAVKEALAISRALCEELRAVVAARPDTQAIEELTAARAILRGVAAFVRDPDEYLSTVDRMPDAVREYLRVLLTENLHEYFDDPVQMDEDAQEYFALVEQTANWLGLTWMEALRQAAPTSYEVDRVAAMGVELPAEFYFERSHQP